jgi:hypothetical protein
LISFCSNFGENNCDCVFPRVFCENMCKTGANACGSLEKYAVFCKNLNYFLKNFSKNVELCDLLEFLCRNRNDLMKRAFSFQPYLRHFCSFLYEGFLTFWWKQIAVRTLLGHSANGLHFYVDKDIVCYAIKPPFLLFLPGPRLFLP